MPAYRAQILLDGQVLAKIIHAPNEAAARAACPTAGGVLLDLRREWKLIDKNGGKFALGLFLEELAILLEAGLVLVEALEALRDKAEPGKKVHRLLGELLTCMYAGQPFSKALAASPEVFPALLVAMVAAAEGSGQLPRALQRFQHYALRLEQVRKQIVSALIYPAVVMTVGMGIMLFMLFFVIPRFSIVFESVRNLPAAAQVMLWWAALVKDHSSGLWAGIVAAVAALVVLLRTAAVRQAALSTLWKLPKLNAYYNLFVLARFYRTAGLLMMGGTAVLDALLLSGNLLPLNFQGRLASALEQLRAGQALSAAMAENRLTTPIAERLLRVGEQSGNLGEMCEKIAHFHDGAIDRGVTMFSKIFEPILMLGVGALVGAIVLLLYMPIFELAGSIG